MLCASQRCHVLMVAVDLLTPCIVSDRHDPKHSAFHLVFCRVWASFLTLLLWCLLVANLLLDVTGHGTSILRTTRGTNWLPIQIRIRGSLYHRPPRSRTRRQHCNHRPPRPSWLRPFCLIRQGIRNRHRQRNRTSTQSRSPWLRWRSQPSCPWPIVLNYKSKKVFLTPKTRSSHLPPAHNCFLRTEFTLYRYVH